MAQGTTTNGAGANTGRIGSSQPLAGMYNLGPYGYYGLTPEQQGVDLYGRSGPGREAATAGAGGIIPGREAATAGAGGAALGQKQGLINIAQMLAKNMQVSKVGVPLSAKNMQVSEAGVPFKYIVPPVNPQEDPGYLRPPTQQDIEYGERLRRAKEQKETGLYPTGYDPEAIEQRITAAERQPHGPGWKEEVGDVLRREQYGPSRLQNMKDILSGAYSNTLGNMWPLSLLPGGGSYNSGWSQQPNLAYPMRRGEILRGEGTVADQNRAYNKEEAEYRHKYYGAPEPPLREQNVYDELGMPQPTYYAGQRDIPLYFTSIGRRAERDLGKYKVAPPGAEQELPVGALGPKGLSTSPYLSNETRNSIMSGKVPVQNLPLGVQSSGPGGPKEKKEGKKKETFNLLKVLLGLLGLPLKLIGLPGLTEE